MPERITRRREFLRSESQKVLFLSPLVSVIAGGGIGAGIGAGLGLAIESTSKSNEDRGLATATLAVLGSAIGAGIAHHYPIIRGKGIYVAN